MFRRILVPVDGSGPSTAGLRVALSLARDRKARLRLVHLSRDLTPAPPRGRRLPVGELYARVKKRGEELLRRHERRCRQRGIAPETALYVAIAGRAADVIVREAKRWRADLIVMGTHGRRGVTRLAIGSDAEQVVRRSPVPVLLSRTGRR
jgi:nucleotide-binding universal stress UspA family protein